MKSIGEALHLSVLSLLVRWRLFNEERKVKRRLYQDPKFQACDEAFLAAYAGCNPYQVSKYFLMQKGFNEIDLYGETPLTTWEKIIAACELSSCDHVVDLGCGRARGLFFLHYKTGCSVQGIEWIPEFVATSKSIADFLRLSKIGFSCENMLEADLKEASCIYLYGTCLDQHSIKRLASAFQKLPKGTKIITVSYALNEMLPSANFTMCKTFKGTFAWGTTDIYLQEV